ncbi:hypothetical protein FA95DRAFT_1562544 [Auriscalpium vulgare]|uniref:Uncharacterized protein n=1 Tax=Auriscalpium vulgare TaxID=40419 RepID=A0ACB8RJW3_9AGAM|nr:hypothetical protein FA95DRAFT_1562544 [Auriscalpium vulgare]
MRALLRCFRWKTLSSSGHAPRPRTQLIIYRNYATSARVNKADSPSIPQAGVELDYVQSARLQSIILNSHRMLRDGRVRDALTYFRLRLDSVAPVAVDNRASRRHAFERITTLLLRHGHLPFAQRIVKNMQEEGLNLSANLRAKLVAAEHFRRAPEVDKEALVADLQAVVALPGFSEENLRELISFMARPPHLDADPIGRIVELYEAAKGHDIRVSTANQLINVYSRSKSLEVAQQFLPDASAVEALAAGLDTGNIAAPYTTMISQLADEDFRNPAQISALLAQMGALSVQPDLPLFNALIAMAVRARDLNKAFALYNTVRNSPSSALLPDAYTFGSIFKAAQMTFHRRTARSRAVKPPPDAPSPRELFRDLLECHIIATGRRPTCRSPVATTSVLNVALRMFMLTKDYRGAYVALVGFKMCALRPDVKTFRVVLVTLLAQVRMDTLGRRVAGEERWVDRFLGGGQGHHVTAAQIKDDAIEDFLFFATRARPPGEAWDDAEQAQLRAPTRAMIEGLELPPKKEKWDLEPLERLVGKAILASLENSEERADRYVERALQPVIAEMIPPMDKSPKSTSKTSGAHSRKGQTKRPRDARKGK